ncbi:TIGR02206 family membrane protein [Sporolactobacillus kofuensis]|uniref:TIGR02206 family membrane protein n=1 Tax=Sporolactobacillus kofuensis TaxID=269672 RepID=A0ABW1WH81_9BACL|nr:TIGR02206 family membrane protein [Sporolactobacillus kofuensis]MCO7175842.1 TIGR02206 family membrane protein [Sporolactobacillus kofuensis]
MAVYLWPQTISFVLFSTQHLWTLLVITLLGVCLFLFRKPIRQALFLRLSVRFGLAAVLLIGELVYQIVTIRSGQWSANYALPLEVSDLAALLSIVMLLSKKWWLFAILYFAGIGSAVQALITPDLGGVSFPHIRYIQFFATHGATVLACLFMIAVERYRPTYRSLWWAAGCLNLYGALIFCFDWWIGANYLYLMHKPNLSILNWLGPWPWYLLWIEVLMVAEFHFLYWPFKRNRG